MIDILVFINIKTALYMLSAEQECVFLYITWSTYIKRSLTIRMCLIGLRCLCVHITRTKHKAGPKKLYIQSWFSFFSHILQCSPIFVMMYTQILRRTLPSFPVCLHHLPNEYKITQFQPFCQFFCMCESQMETASLQTAQTKAFWRP